MDARPEIPDMEVKCTCPYCAGVFTINVNEPEKPRKKRNVSEETRAKRAEHMRQLRAQGIGGRPKGVKETKHRSTFGKARGGENGETEG